MMRRYIDLIESPTDDVTAYTEAWNIYKKLYSYFYEGGKTNIEVETNNRTYYGIEATAIGCKVDDLVFCFGTKRSGKDSARYIQYNEPVLMGYDKIIFFDALPTLDDAYVSTFLGKSNDMIIHELIHYIDSKRNAIQPKSYELDDGTIDNDKYYNDPSEFNAFFTNIAERYLDFLRVTIDDPKYRKDYAVLYGISEDFTSNLKTFMTDSRNAHIRRFIKHLTSDRRKALIRRLYKLHEEVISKLK